MQRIHAELFQHGVAVPEGADPLGDDNAGSWLAGDRCSSAGAARQRIEAGYQMIDATDAEALPLQADLQRFGTRQPACKALVAAHYGIGGLLAVAVWSELGDCRRFSRSDQVVRHTGLDVTVDSSDRHRGRWAPVPAGSRDAALGAVRGRHERLAPAQPRPRLLPAVKKRHDGKMAAISMARKLARRCYHTLRSIDPEVVYAMPA